MKRVCGMQILVALVAAVFAGGVWLCGPVAAADKAAKKPLEIQAAPAAEEKDAFIVITAEGLADPNADAYKRDKALMIEDPRRHANAQIREKAGGGSGGAWPPPTSRGPRQPGETPWRDAGARPSGVSAVWPGSTGG